MNVQDGELSLKIFEMGLHPGKVVKVIGKAPLGDPIAVEIGGSVLAIRKEEALLLNVEELNQ